MNTELPFFNWSIRKLLATEENTFERAKISILFTILAFSILKVLVVIGITGYYGQQLHLIRGIVLLMVYLVLTKLLLAGKIYLRSITHVLLIIGLLLIWTAIFISTRTINLILMQFVFMAVLSSYYLLNKRWGLIYSLFSAAPVILFEAFGTLPVFYSIPADEMAAPGGFIIILLNFVTIILAHYLYHNAFSINVNEKTDLNKKLEGAVSEARENARTKSEFLSIMSHELRTPLNSVIGMTELLLESEKQPEQKENLKVLKFSALSLHTLINDILDFNKLDSNKLEMESTPMNLYEQIRNVCQALEIQAREKGVELTCNCDPDIRGLIIISDPTRLTQIIYNLVGNGLKFTSAGYVKVELKLKSRTATKAEIEFIIEDSGIGIETEKQILIFEPFVQASSNTTRRFGGTGLGLSIVKRLLSLFGSEIHLESKIGQGSRFYFVIDFQVSDNMIPELIAGESAEDLEGLRVLIAEDNPMNTYLIKKLCEKWKIEPVIAENGYEVLEHLHAKDFDVILMDIHMPLLNGYDASRRIRTMSPEKASIPIIALTASVSENINEKIRQAGMNDYVTKPFNHRDLFNKLKKIRVLKQ